MNKRIKKFTLHRETLRHLTEQHLAEARGAIQTGVNTMCVSNCLGTCVTHCGGTICTVLCK